jgi:putative ATP-binding cassette transporter
MSNRRYEFLYNLLKLSAVYWRSEEWRVSGALLGCALGITIGLVYLSVLMNEWQRLFFNAVQNIDRGEFVYQIFRFAFLCIAYSLAYAYQVYLRQMLEIRWRRWLSERYIGQWLNERKYYRLQLGDTVTDNPDQRIAEDLKQFSIQTINLFFGFIQSIGSLGTFATILWGLSGSYRLGGFEIPGFLLWVALTYSVAGTYLAHSIGRPLIGLDREQQQFEADYRFSLVRLRENAEGIAAYGGEEIEKHHLTEQLGKIVNNWGNIITRQKRLNYFIFGYGQMTTVFPYLLTAPRYFSGVIQLGEVMQSVNAFGRVQGALSWFIYAYSQLADWKATVDRLIGFEETLTEVSANSAGLTRREGAIGGGIYIEKLHLQLPDNAVLLQDLALHFPPGSRTLLSGPPGCGKSKLFHAITGLWPYCSGSVEFPVQGRMLYLPQKNYLPIATLRQAVTYPETAEACDDIRIMEVLELCGLAHLGSKLDKNQYWSQQLSPGEQQQLAFVRVLLFRPDWLFLDEATSALDEETEARLYRLIAERLPKMAVISIAHRRTLERFHERHLVLNKSGGLTTKTSEKNSCDLRPEVFLS